MVVLSLSLVIGVILHRTLFDSQVEYLASRRFINELKARYNAQSGMELNLLRVKIFKEVQKVLSGEKQESLLKPYVDFIWRGPVFWPLNPVGDMSEVDKKNLWKTKSESFVRGNYWAEILPEDGKIGLNSLGSSVNYLRNFTADSLYALLFAEADKKEIELDESKISIIFNNIADWIDKDTTRRTGGSEELIDADSFPLNRSFLSLEELKSVPNMTEEIYRMLLPYISVYGVGGLNINYASKPLLQAIGLSEELAVIVLSRTQPASIHYKPFGEVKGFCDFLSDQGSDLCSFLEGQYGTLNMLQFHTPSHFLIKGQGSFQGIYSQMEALVYDANMSLRSYKDAVETQNKLIKAEKEGDPAALDNVPQNEKSEKDKEDSKMQYQSFSPMHIMYWKEN